MKKYILIFAFLLCLFPSFAYAGDYDDFSYDGYKTGTTLDDVGHVIAGSFYTTVNVYNNTQDNNWYYQDLYNLSVSDGGYIYGIQQGNGYIYFYGSGTLKVSHFSCSYIDDKYNNTTCDTSTYTLNDTYNNMYRASYYFNTEDTFYNQHVNDSRLIYVMDSIPIFNSSDENLSKYVESYIKNGDYSGALNADDITLEPPVDDNIALPKNLRTYGDLSLLKSFLDSSTSNMTSVDRQLAVRWDIDDDNIDSYSYDVQIRFFSKITSDEATWGPWKTVVDNYPYEAGNLVDLDTGENVKRTSAMPETYYFNNVTLLNYYNITSDELGASLDRNTQYNSCDLEIRVRNRCSDSASNWVSISFNNLTGGGSTASVTDSDGNVIDSDEYNGGSVDNTNHDTYYDTDSDYYNNVAANDLSLNTIMSYIKNGFGLLGSDGLLALMAKTFSYLPSSIWTILNFFVSILVVVALIAIVKKLVF